MLTKIKVKNYKGFKEAEIPIEPITVLLGANSSGKSSMLHLLLLLKQTAEEATDSYKSALKIYGNRINIGKPENLFYGFECSDPIYLQIDFNNVNVKHMLVTALQWYISEVSKFDFESRLKEKDVVNRDKIKEFFEVGLDKNRLRKDSNNFWRYGFNRFISEFNVLGETPLSLIRTYDFLTNLNKKIKETSFSIIYTISYYKKELVISSFSMKYENVTIFSYNNNDNKGFSSDIIDLDKDDEAFLESNFSYNSSIFNLFDDKKDSIFDNNYVVKNSKETSLTKTIIYIIKNVLSDFRDEFKESMINYVGPLRAHPQRYYMLDKTNITYSLDTFDADAIAEVIKDKRALKNKVNNWFRKFSLEVTVEEFKEAIHKLTVNQSGLHLDIPDVGFSISQVLPVVLQGFLSPSDSITIIEQPEVHLHPKMQAALADLFIDIVKASGMTKHLIIETHSEYLLKRLRRRMAEGDNIIPKYVSINLFHTRTENTYAKIENLSIEDKGAFEWPKEYYDDELYDDVVKFLELQGNGNIYINN